MSYGQFSAGLPATCEVRVDAISMQYQTAHTQHVTHKYTDSNAMVFVWTMLWYLLHSLTTHSKIDLT